MDEVFKISESDRANVEELLKHKKDITAGSYGKSVPVWLGDEENGGLDDLTVGEDWERWGMLSQKGMVSIRQFLFILMGVLLTFDFFATYTVLWPLLHYILPTPTDGESERQWWRDYLQFNIAFADKIMEVYKPGDIVWVHDYQLLLVPKILRQRIGPNIYVGLFLHTPFPSSEIIRCLSSK